MAAGEQALLFLNRRGYAPLTLCRACGHRFQCPSCTAWLVEHRFTGAAAMPPLRLFDAGAGRSARNASPPAALVPCGPGVERLSEEVAARFPEARTALMVSDLLPGPRAAAELAEAMAAHRYDVLIGTQIVAKGHHFPMLTLVGVVDADLGLGGGDLRAAERTYQLLHQVGGRAGRGRAAGPGAAPDLYARAAGDAGARRRRPRPLSRSRGRGAARGALPPFGRLAALIVSAPDPDAADFAARALARAAPQMPGVDGARPGPGAAGGAARPAPPPLSGQGRALRSTCRRCCASGSAKVRFAGSARLQVDIDPYSFL